MRLQTGRTAEVYGFTDRGTLEVGKKADLNLIDLLVRSAEIEPADVVLEVGCGTGVVTERVSAAAARVVSAEIDPRLAQLARDRLI